MEIKSIRHSTTMRAANNADVRSTRSSLNQLQLAEERFREAEVEEKVCCLPRNGVAASSYLQSTHALSEIMSDVHCTGRRIETAG